MALKVAKLILDVLHIFCYFLQKIAEMKNRFEFLAWKAQIFGHIVVIYENHY